MSSEADRPQDGEGNPSPDAVKRHPLEPRGSHKDPHTRKPGHPEHATQHSHAEQARMASRQHEAHDRHAPRAKTDETPHDPKKGRGGHKGNGHGKPFFRQSRFWTLWVPIIVAVLLIGGCVYIEKHKKPKAPAGPPTVPVSVTQVRTGNIDVILDALGTVTPVYTVSLTARVTGEITEIHYTEGQMVGKGDLLLVIDPRPYAAAEAQASGQLARDQAMADNAKIDLGRYQDAFKTHAVPEQQVATQQATVKADEGTVLVDQGNLEAASLNLDFCQVRSPIDGRVGLRLVDLGNLVTANGATPLVTITQLQPITVIFTLSEDYLDEVAPEIAKGKPLPVDALDRSEQKQIAQGSLDTLDNQVNTSTGTVRARASFPNTKFELFPNQFVNAKLHVKTLTNVLLVPTTAIQHNDTAAFVYVVQSASAAGAEKGPGPADDGGDAAASKDASSGDPGNGKDTKDGKAPTDPNAQVAKSTPVTITATEGDTAAVTGVKAGDTLVTDGFEKLQDGSPVSVKKPGQPKAPGDKAAPDAKKGPASDGDKE
jgi:multidrug efflux system membrane fusion protein